LVSLELRGTPLSFTLEHGEGMLEQKLLWTMTQWGHLRTLKLWSRQGEGVPPAVEMWRWHAIPPGTTPPGSPRRRPLHKGPPPKPPEPQPRPAAARRPQPKLKSPQSAVAPWPAVGSSSRGAVGQAIASLERRLEGSSQEARQRLLRQLYLEWHPDKQPGNERAATQVFQWLQSVKDSSA